MGIRAKRMSPGGQIFGNPEVYNTFVSGHGAMILFTPMPADRTELGSNARKRLKGNFGDGSDPLVG
jgi:cytochrome c oxidase subunit I